MMILLGWLAWRPSMSRGGGRSHQATLVLGRRATEATVVGPRTEVLWHGRPERWDLPGQDPWPALRPDSRPRPRPPHGARAGGAAAARGRCRSAAPSGASR